MITNGFRFCVGVSLALGLICPSAAVGDGAMFLGAQYTAGDRPRSVAIGDLDGDQAPDLAVANSGPTPAYDGTVSVLLGVGDGTFAAAVHYPAGDKHYSVAIGDLDGDQVPDLAVANYYSDNVWVLLGVGDGTFAAAADYLASSGPHSVAIGDLDDDQISDLVVANYKSDGVSVLLNLSSRSGDVDGDGDVDLDDFALFEGCMTGPNNAPYPRGCAAFDLDRDLDVDLADFLGVQRAFGPIP